jgi:hypothetical protein
MAAWFEIIYSPYENVCILFERRFQKQMQNNLRFLGAFAKFRKATIIFVMSVRPSARENSASTERIVKKFDTFFEKSLENSSFIKI